MGPFFISAAEIFFDRSLPLNFNEIIIKAYAAAADKFWRRRERHGFST
jgi:hypothetical protein